MTGYKWTAGATAPFGTCTACADGTGTSGPNITTCDVTCTDAKAKHCSAATVYVSCRVGNAFTAIAGATPASCTACTGTGCSDCAAATPTVCTQCKDGFYKNTTTGVVCEACTVEGCLLCANGKDKCN